MRGHIIGRFLAGVMAVMAVGGHASAVCAQTRQVWVRVAAATGAPIKGLLPGQFTVIEDGVRYPVIKAEPMEWPTKLTVLVDNGGKAADYLLNLRHGVRDLFAEVAGTVE